MPSRVLDNYLRVHRKRSGLTLREASLLLGGRDRSLFYRYERGRRPSLETALICEKLFGVSVSAFFPGPTSALCPKLVDRMRHLSTKLQTAQSKRQGRSTTHKLQWLASRLSALETNS